MFYLQPLHTSLDETSCFTFNTKINTFSSKFACLVITHTSVLSESHIQERRMKLLYDLRLVVPKVWGAPPGGAQEILKGGKRCETI
jgi:hypothetical protein